MRGVYVGKRQKTALPLVIALVVPLVLIVLFELLRGNTTVMRTWVMGILMPVAQFLGRMWGWIPFAVGELSVVLLGIAVMIWCVRAVVLLIQERDVSALVRRMGVVLVVALWAVAGMNWMWNATYYAPSFSERSGLYPAQYTAEDLLEVTIHFAQKAGELSTQMERDVDGNFAVERDEILSSGVDIYDNIEEEFPCLAMPHVQTKPLLFSKFQSILGFTGVYFPFTGEANVNVHSPTVSLPVTVAHEMAHQRLIAQEQEANFIGIAASVASDDVTYQYSGYLFGLIQLSNALQPLVPEVWSAIVEEYFTAEMRSDWNGISAYWQTFESPVEEIATAQYDTFLKGNDQALGMLSYGACVDLLVTYYGTEHEK